jgi:hypothetical protein
MVILKKPGPKQSQQQQVAVPQQHACPFAGEHVRLPLMTAQVIDWVHMHTDKRQAAPH